MSVDVLILNTAVVDFRSDQFAFASEFVRPGGLVKCDVKDMPRYSQQQYQAWIEHGKVSAGGPANCAPLLARSGFKTAVGANLGKGDFDGFDAIGRYFYDILAQNDVNLSGINVHPTLPTGITYIYETGSDERGGLCYFPNANNDFDFGHFKDVVTNLKPKIVYYMYSGLSTKGDANGGEDLAEFISRCRQAGCITLVDSVTLASDPRELSKRQTNIKAYNLLLPVLPEVDLFFISSDEAKLIAQTFGWAKKLINNDENENNQIILNCFAEHFWKDNRRPRIFGITTSDGAFEKHTESSDIFSEPCEIKSRFMSNDVVDLVGAGDSFRAGVLAYILKNRDRFKAKTLNWHKSINMGNLYASLYIKAPLNDRYANILPYEDMLSKLNNCNAI